MCMSLLYVKLSCHYGIFYMFTYAFKYFLLSSDVQWDLGYMSAALHIYLGKLIGRETIQWAQSPVLSAYHRLEQAERIYK